jgi:hypothetical protein
MYNPTLIGILGLLAIAACWALAVVLYRVGPAGSVARQLAVLLVIEGFVLATAGFPEFAAGLGDFYSSDFIDRHPNYAIFSFVTHHLSDAAMLALYPPFLAAALRTRMTQPFSRKGVRIVVVLTSAALFVGTVASVALWESLVVMMCLYFTMMLMFAFGLVASIHAWRTAKSGLTRERAGIFALAFGVRDVGWCLSYAISAWAIWTVADPFGMTDSNYLGKTVYALGTLFAVPLIAYGILRAHLFDIDLKIRWTIKQSTLATIVVTFVFLLSEGADRFLSAELGNYAGLFAAAVVVFFLAPLQRFAENVASKAMPNTKNTPEYAAHRKMQVYEAAVAEAVPDGIISERERALLNSLRDSLDISASDAEMLESELLAGGVT